MLPTFTIIAATNQQANPLSLSPCSWTDAYEPNIFYALLLESLLDFKYLFNGGSN